MTETIKIGDIAVPMVCNALTPILFKNTFHKDFLSEIRRQANIRKSDPRVPDDVVEKMSITEREAYLDRLEEFTNEAYKAVQDMTESSGQIAYIMAHQYKAMKDQKIKIFDTSETAYFEWLSQFDLLDMSQAIPEIMGVYTKSTTTTSERKN